MPRLCGPAFKADCGKMPWCAAMLVLTEEHFLMKRGFIGERCVFSEK